jgi:hypothetical protein
MDVADSVAAVGYTGVSFLSFRVLVEADRSVIVIT